MAGWVWMVFHSSRKVERLCANFNHVHSLLSDLAERTRVGPEYQAVIPEFIPPSERLPAPRQDAGSDCWLPAEHLPEELCK